MVAEIIVFLSNVRCQRQTAQADATALSLSTHDFHFWVVSSYSNCHDFQAGRWAGRAVVDHTLVF